MTHATETIRKLNNDFRRSLAGGRIVMTPGIAALGPDAVTRLIGELITYDDFDDASNPHGENDFGSIQIGDETAFWKIDYYDQDLAAHSPDPADPAVTQRILTLMTSQEY